MDDPQLTRGIWQEINGVRRTWFCGAYWGFGFHEDGARSALAVTEQFGLTLDTIPPLRNEYLRDLIIAGRAKPSFIVSHRLPLTEAPSAYDRFDRRADGYTKVILKPMPPSTYRMGIDAAT